MYEALDAFALGLGLGLGILTPVDEDHLRDMTKFDA